MNQITIAPSMLCADFARLGEQTRQVEEVRGQTDLHCNAHLMVGNPASHIQSFARAGADSVLIQREVVSQPAQLLSRIRDLGLMAGLVFNPATPLAGLESIADKLDIVLIMTVEPGTAGQKFMPAVLPKVRQARQLLDEVNPEARIMVDGGVDDQTTPELVAAGAEILVCGSYLFQHPDGLAAAIQSLRDAAGSTE